MNVRVIPMMNNEVEIIMPKELQTKNYADEYLKIQNLCNESYSKVRVVFENTLWIDNLALMQLFLYLRKLKNLGKQIFFEFKIDSDVTEQVRFIKYMEDYGFFNSIKELSDDINYLDLSLCYSGWGYQNMEDGDFKNSECFMPFKIISKREAIQEYLDIVVQTFKERFSNYYSGYEKEAFLFRMLMFLQETIGNVFEHAFANPEEAFCGVMIRYMHKVDLNSVSKKRRAYYGIQGDRTASRAFRTSSFTYNHHCLVAEEHNPYRNSTGMKVLENYVQIFVVDIGMGLLKSMGISDAKMERNLINEIFQKGTRTNKKMRNTLVGGLGTLYQLLQKKENYISIKGEYNWARIACTKKNDNNGTLEYVHKDGITSKDVLNGFAVVGYIDCDYERKKEMFTSVEKKYVEDIYQREYILTDLDDIVDIDMIDFRFEIPDLSKQMFLKNTVLCFVGMNLEKSIWSNKIANLFEKTDSKYKTLILVDIPEQEMRKYELIFEAFKINVNMAVLLTHSLELAVFTCGREGKLHYDSKKTENYINTDNQDITQSLRALIQAIRKYDSQKFWLTVSETQKTKETQLFINGEVIWNVEESNRMNGYLDFSQACFDEKIKNLLIYQLFRLPNCGLIEKYFVSMDRFTEDLCENINGKLQVPLVEKESLCIRLGSVYVTGTSSEMSKLYTKEDDIEEYYYFLHPLIADKRIKKINALLLWPSKEIADTLFDKDIDSIKFKRLAKTPFLAHKGTAYFSEQHYKDIRDSIDLKTDEMYSVLQSENLWMNKLIQIAHVDMVGYHEYVYLNAKSIFNKHFMESRYNVNYSKKNSFDYLLKKMYIALGKTSKKSYQKSIELDIQPQYRKVVEGKISENDLPDSQGIFVYLADYETMEIVSKMKEIFSEEMQKRIIPIAPISKKRGSSALLVSPVLMESIRSKFEKILKDNPNTCTRVTIFIASVTSTRLQGELKHILYRLGAKEIKCISIVDRQRFPLGSREKESYNSFCKLDLPNLGSENRCKLCLGIYRMYDLKGQLVSSGLQKRCDEIAFTWGKVKASDNLYRRGVKSRNYKLSQQLKKNIEEICCQYQIGKIEINTDVGLVLFSIENTAITMSIDFLMNCLDDEKIDDEIRILMISAHLNLFGGDEIVPTDKYYLVEYLYKILQRQTNANEYTGLASVIILSQEPQIKDKLHEYYKTHWQWVRFNNVDFIITSVGILTSVENQRQDKVLRYWLKKTNEEPIDYLYGVFLLTDGNRYTRHKTMLARLREVGWRMSKMDYISAYNDAAFLEMAYQSLPHSYFTNPEDCQRKREDIIVKIKNLTGALEKAMDEMLTTEERRKLSSQTIAMFNSASAINTELFMSTEQSKLWDLRRRLQGLVAEQNKTEGEELEIEQDNKAYVNCYVNIIKHDESSDEKYFCYLEDLQREISYLIRDFRHCDKGRYMKAADSEYYNGIIDVVFEKDYMKYSFKNYVSDDFMYEETKKRKKLKYNRPTILSLQMLFTKSVENELFYYHYNEKEKIFTVELRIPYLNV